MKNYSYPKRIPVKVYWDETEQRIKVFNSKGDVVKTLYCASSLSMYYEDKMLDGRVERDLSNFKESKGYYFLKNHVRVPLTNDFNYFAWVEEDGTAIINYDRVREVINYYGNKGFL